MLKIARAVNRSLIQWILTIAGLSGVASIFLPFFSIVGGFSPFEVAFDREYWIFGAPSLLTIVISASLIRWNLTGRLSLLEKIIIYLIGLSMMAVVMNTYFEVLHSDILGAWISGFFSASFLIAGIFLVIRNLRIGKFRALSPIMLMQTVCIGDGIFCLIFFGGGWEFGAYFVLFAVIVYAAQMAWISCQKKIISADKS
jgi:hypothetical protein